MFIKICGITTEEDALLSVGLGADAIGFVFAPSPRQISPQQARDIARRIPREALTVGVFRNESKEAVVRIMGEIGLGAAQLHGVETPETVNWVAERVPAVIKGFSAETGELERAHEFKVKYILLDAAEPGSGTVFDWSLAENAPRGVKLIMAGGLTPDNVGAAITKARPWGVDVSSGVEAKPGHKNPALLRSFIDAAREAADQLGFSGGAGGMAGADEPGEFYDWELE